VRSSAPASKHRRRRFCEYGLPLSLFGRPRDPCLWMASVASGDWLRGEQSTLISAPSRAWSPESVDDVSAPGVKGANQPVGGVRTALRRASDRNWELATDRSRRIQRWTYGEAARCGYAAAPGHVSGPAFDRLLSPIAASLERSLLGRGKSVLSGSCLAAHELVSSAAFQREFG